MNVFPIGIFISTNWNLSIKVHHAILKGTLKWEVVSAAKFVKYDI